MAGELHHAEFGVCRGVGVVLSEMRSCVFMYSLEYVVFGNAAATFKYYLVHILIYSARSIDDIYMPDFP